MASPLQKLPQWQPFKSLFFAVAIAYEALRLPITLAVCLVPTFRPVKQWTFRSCLMNYLLVRLSNYGRITATKGEPWDLSPGKEGDRFELVQPTTLPVYRDLLASAASQPDTLGGIWHPRKPSGDELDQIKSGTKNIVLHFHGGSYARGSGRDKFCKFAGDNLSNNVGATFCASYRLSSQGFTFPTALQDAVTQYARVVHDLEAAPESIVISGDSAGGNLAIALLRYIEQVNDPELLPRPGHMLLWSPWTDAESTFNGSKDIPVEKWRTDFLTIKGMTADALAFIGSASPSNPYINAVAAPFRTCTKIRVHAGSCEVLYDQIERFVRNMQAQSGNVVEFSVTPNAMHDIFLAGNHLGFQAQAEREVELAGKFVKQGRKTAE